MRNLTALLSFTGSAGNQNTSSFHSPQEEDNATKTSYYCNGHVLLTHLGFLFKKKSKQNKKPDYIVKC